MEISNDIINMLLPMVIIMIPSLLLYMEIKDKSGLIVGAIIGVVIAISGGLIGEWAILVSIIALITLYMGKQRILGVGNE